MAPMPKTITRRKIQNSPKAVTFGDTLFGILPARGLRKTAESNHLIFFINWLMCVKSRRLNKKRSKQNYADQLSDFIDVKGLLKIEESNTLISLT
jgi:hypothetical protein